MYTAGGWGGGGGREDFFFKTGQQVQGRIQDFEKGGGCILVPEPPIHLKRPGSPGDEDGGG